MNIQPTFRHKPRLTDNMDVSAFVHAQVSRDGLGVRVSESFYVPSLYRRPDELAWRDAQTHPRRIVYAAPAAARAVAMALERPGYVICGISALAVFGLRFFADACDTTLSGPAARRQDGGPISPALFRRTRPEQWTVLYRGAQLRISPPPVAAVETLKHMSAGVHMWDVGRVLGLGDDEVRAIQLIDVCRSLLGIDAEDIRSAGRQRIDKRWLDSAINRSSRFAESPKETEMRLLCLRVCAAYGLILSEQVPLYDGPTLITTFDLAIVELKIGVMYDGEHHLERSQRDRDSRINIESSIQGWTVLRFTAGTLQAIAVLLERVIRAKLGLEGAGAL